MFCLVDDTQYSLVLCTQLAQFVRSARDPKSPFFFPLTDKLLPNHHHAKYKRALARNVANLSGFLKFIDHHNTDWNDEFGILITLTISISTIMFSIKVGAADTK